MSAGDLADQVKGSETKRLTMNPFAYALGSSAIRRAQLVFVARMRLAVILGAATLLVALAGCGGSGGNGGGGSNPPTGATGRVIVNLIWPERNTRYIPVPARFIRLEVTKGAAVLGRTDVPAPAAGQPRAVSATIVVPAADGLLLRATAYERNPAQVAPHPTNNNALATATSDPNSLFEVTPNAVYTLPNPITMNTTIARLRLVSVRKGGGGPSRLVPIGNPPTSYTLILPREANTDTAGEQITVSAQDASGNTVMTHPEEIRWGVTDADAQISIQGGVRRSGANLVGNPVQVIGKETTYSSIDNTDHPFTLTITAPAEVSSGETQRTINVLITVLPLRVTLGLPSTVTVGVNEVIPLNELFDASGFAMSYTKVSGPGPNNVPVAGNTYTPTQAGDYEIEARLTALPLITARITLDAVAPSITISGPSSVNVPVNGQQAFNATANNLYNKAISWSIAPAVPSPGSFDPATRTFKAPGTAGGSFTVTARSGATFAASATVPSDTVGVTVTAQ